MQEEAFPGIQRLALEAALTDPSAKQNRVLQAGGGLRWPVDPDHDPARSP